MEIYLPIAEMSVHWLTVIGLGLGAGFLFGGARDIYSTELGN